MTIKSFYIKFVLGVDLLGADPIDYDPLSSFQKEILDPSQRIT